MNKFNHPFHLVSVSPWPLMMSLSLLITLSGGIMMFFNYKFILLMMGVILSILIMYQWWRDIIRESTFQGCHSIKVSNLMRMGMLLFIISEIFFFISFFWAFFHMSLSPSIEIGSVWPPIHINSFNPYNIPLLNTIVLLTSGLSITWSHYEILFSNYYKSLISLMLTIILGIYFSILQYFEYYEASFNISDSVYGSIFFMITGFHGLHVIIGTIFIIIMFIRLKLNHLSSIHHFGFEASSWYWHFVDVVWLFVYIFLYWWNY